MAASGKKCYPWDSAYKYEQADNLITAFPPPKIENNLLRDVAGKASVSTLAKLDN